MIKSDDFLRLVEVSRRLAEVTEALGQRIADVEKTLAQSGAAVRATVDFKLPDGTEASVGYGKIGGEFHLFYTDPARDPVALGSAPRASRIAALPHVGRLVVALVAETERQVDEMQAVLEEVKP